MGSLIKKMFLPAWTLEVGSTQRSRRKQQRRQPRFQGLLSSSLDWQRGRDDVDKNKHENIEGPQPG